MLRYPAASYGSGRPHQLFRPCHCVSIVSHNKPPWRAVTKRAGMGKAPEQGPQGFQIRRYVAQMRTARQEMAPSWAPRQASSSAVHGGTASMFLCSMQGRDDELSCRPCIAYLRSACSLGEGATAAGSGSHLNPALRPSVAHRGLGRRGRLAVTNTSVVPQQAQMQT